MRTMHEWLRSEETGLPFSHCVSCHVPLLEIDAPWLITKDYYRGECVLEYAICQHCRDRMSEAISQESKNAVREFLENEIDWDSRVADFMEAEDLAGRFDRCIACQTAREQTDGFAISALLDSGGELVIGPLPLLICRTCIDRMTAQLSDASRKLWRRFMEEHFAGPPDDKMFPGLL